MCIVNIQDCGDSELDMKCILVVYDEPKSDDGMCCKNVFQRKMKCMVFFFWDVLQKCIPTKNEVHGFLVKRGW
jgi:hypothetical protein